MTSKQGAPDDPVAYLNDLLQQAEDLVKPWPTTHQAWRQYIDEQITPVIKKFIQA